MERKYGNAVRALAGGRHALPQPAALARVQHWKDRLEAAGHTLPQIIVFTK